MNGKLRHAACFTNWWCCLSMMLAISGRVHDTQVHVLAFAHLSIKMNCLWFLQSWPLVLSQTSLYDPKFATCIRVVAVLLTPLMDLIMSNCFWNKTTCKYPKILVLLQTSSCTCVLLLASTWTKNLAKVLRIAKQKHWMTSWANVYSQLCQARQNFKPRQTLFFQHLGDLLPSYGVLW